MKQSIHFFYEKCNNHSMATYPYFMDKLKQIEKIIKPIPANDQSLIKKSCDKCKKNKLYQLGGIQWSNNIKHLIETHESYPSDYFIKVIMNTCIIDNHIVNPPIILNSDQIDRFTYIPLRHNKLLIIDALMHQGSYPRYENNNDFVYSEHSGGISVKNNIVDNIIVSAKTNRIDADDKTIFLPVNTADLIDYEYLFHTHPNTTTYAGRIKDGVIYEFPSANDIFNFVKYHNEGRAQASLIAAPEGTYLIRPIQYQSQFDVNPNLFYYLRKFILKLEKLAIKKNNAVLDKLSDPDIFHEKVSSNFRYINTYNRFIEPGNLFVEYYPREKKNGEWCLRQVNLPYISS